MSENLKLFKKLPPVISILITGLFFLYCNAYGQSFHERVSEKDGAVQVWVPPGSFVMGIDDPEMPYERAERPPHPVTITNGFWMDKFEVTNEQYALFLNRYMEKEKVTGYSDMFKRAFGRVDLNHRLCGIMLDEAGKEFSAKPGWENIPVMPVNWTGAREYAETMGKRLPTEAQWEYAARGPENFMYPWGNQWDPDRANVNTQKPVPAGSKHKDISPFGVMDMAGNVREWVYDRWQPDFYSRSPEKDPVNPAGAWEWIPRAIRGGGFAFTEWDSRTTSRGNRAYAYFPVGTGFRCIETGEPPEK